MCKCIICWPVKKTSLTLLCCTWSVHSSWGRGGEKHRPGLSRYKTRTHVHTQTSKEVTDPKLTKIDPRFSRFSPKFSPSGTTRRGSDIAAPLFSSGLLAAQPQPRLIAPKFQRTCRAQCAMAKTGESGPFALGVPFQRSDRITHKAAVIHAQMIGSHYLFTWLSPLPSSETLRTRMPGDARFPLQTPTGKPQIATFRSMTIQWH